MKRQIQSNYIMDCGMFATAYCCWRASLHAITIESCLLPAAVKIECHNSARNTKKKPASWYEANIQFVLR